MKLILRLSMEEHLENLGLQCKQNARGKTRRINYGAGTIFEWILIFATCRVCVGGVWGKGRHGKHPWHFCPLTAARRIKSACKANFVICSGRDKRGRIWLELRSISSGMP